MKHETKTKIPTIIRFSYSFLGSYLFGLILMFLLLVVTFAGTIFQVEYGPSMGVEEAIESFFGAYYVLIPLGGERSMITLPLPGMPILCSLLFINLLVGGVLQAKWSRYKFGILTVHIGSLLLLLSIILGNRLTNVIEQIPILEGETVKVEGLPFQLTLNKFTPEFYEGTNKPKSFQSDLSIATLDGVGIPAVIKMNEPLRLQGWTLYQLSWKNSVQDNRLVSVLRASNNPLDHGPKWASYIISFGLLWHFSWMFIKFLKRKNDRVEKAAISQNEQPSPEKRPISWKLVAIIGGVLLIFGIGMIAAKPPKEYTKVDGYKRWSPEFIELVDQMAVQDGGRIKPASTYAGFQMLRFLGKRSLVIEANGEKLKLSPTEWMLDCMFRPTYAVKYPVFLINRDEIITQLGLPSSHEKRKKLSLEQINPHWKTLGRHAQRLALMPSDRLNSVDQDILGLHQNVQIMQNWVLMAKWLLQSPETMDQLVFPAWFPGGDVEYEHGKWFKNPTLADTKAIAQSVYLAMLSDKAGLPPLEAEELLNKVLVQPNLESSKSHRESLHREVGYYRLDPLYIGLGLFVAAFVALLISSIFPSKPTLLSRFFASRGLSFAWMVGLMGALVLVYALTLRTMITMRSPVGNTYETIAFIACCGVICSLIAELISKKGIMLAAGLILGAFACQMAVMYESSRATDHMDPLIAILRSNFLLSTHVITIVLGYAAGMLAAVVAHVYLIARSLKLMSDDTARQLNRVSYGILCFSLTFTLVGTVFGGIWGNESWGRFWGWDPKENGALMIILWQLIILHAKRAKYIRAWGVQFSNLIGGVIIAFAWWGVNMMGIGLHSYGFTSGQHALNTFYLIELCVLILAFVLSVRARRLRIDL